VKKKLILLAPLLMLLPATSACSTIAPAEKVGLWYERGQFDGDKFSHCAVPGKSDEVNWDGDGVFWLTTSVRTWNIAPSGGDTNQALVVMGKPDAGQQSGVEVLVWVQTNFMLNTYCGADEKDPNAPFNTWWRKLGDRYDADTPEGWKDMLNNTVIPALEKAKNVLRAYTADELVLGSVWKDAEPIFAKEFSDELTRLSGGNFFCSPTFDRSNPKCDQVEVAIKDVDYRDAGIQDARNNKQKALENAQAEVIKAQGEVAAAKERDQLYQNQAWVDLQKAQLKLDTVKACAASQKCTLIIDETGNVQVHTS
jgi:hypothetical protein